VSFGILLGPYSTRHTVAMTFNQTVAAEVRAEMARQRMSARELSRRSGLAQATLARKIRGDAELGLDDIDVIAEALGVDVVDLIPRRLPATGTGGGPTPQVLARATRTNRQKAGTGRNGMSAQSRPRYGQSPDQAVTRLDSYRIRAA